jgi:WD40 repeat protein
LWNRNGSPPQQIDSYGINNVYFAPNSRLLASTQTDKTIRLWTIGGNPIKTLRGHNAAVNKIAFSSDSKQLISGSLDNTVRLWQVAGSNEKSISLVGRHPSGVYNVHFSPDNKVITSISTTYDPSNLSNPSKIDRYDIQFWNRSGKPLSPFGGKDVDPAILSVMFSSKDLFINSAIISSSDKNDTEPDKNGTDSVGFSSDHRIINLVSRNENSNVSIQFLGQDGRSLRKLSETQVRQVSFSPDGRSVVLAKEQSYTLRLWNFEGKLISTIPGLNSTVNSVSFSPHQTIAIGNDSGIVELWSWNGTLIKSLKGHTEKVNSVVFSPDGNLLASASDDKTVRLWKSDGTLIRQLDGHAAAVLNVIFSPDSKTLVSSN